MSMSDTPLDDVLVLDFSQIRAGPWCTQILGELGAEVVKVERPGVGESSRGSYPEQNGMGVNFIARNRNKQSIALDLKTDRGQAIAADLAREADVLVENFGPGVMADFGLDYDTLSDVHPGLVYASIKGYGENGPDAGRKGVDLVMQAEGGIMSVTGPEGGPPMKVGQAIGDIGAGLYAVIGILTALRERDRTGEGQKVSTDLFGTIVSFMEEYLTMYGITGEDPTPFGTRHQTAVPYELFETADGHLALLVPGQRWARFCEEILDAPELAEYDSARLRQEHYDEIMDVMRPVLRERTTAEWRETFDEFGLPSGPLNRVSDVVEHPQARAQGYVFEYDDPNVGEVTLHGHPLHFSKAERTVRRGPPLLGEHTEAVLADVLGLTDAEIRDLYEAEVVA
jgi:crotonobetainyl-CoA:carnitine CoA-transferase CaiB-like acyl-CoA transferase